MSPQLTVIDSIPAIEKLIEYLKDKDLVAYDIETTGTTQTGTIIGYSICAADDRAFYVITNKWTHDNQSLIPIDYKGLERQLIQGLIGKQLIMHNGVFDCAITEAYYKIRLIDSLHTDTMILAHLLNENRRVGLKELAKEYFGADSTKEAAEMKASVLANGGQLTKKCFEMYKADSYLMGKYGAQDALLTFKLFHELVPELIDQGLEQFFYEDESMPLLRGPTYDLNTTGTMVDLKRLASLKNQLQAECLEAKDYIYSEIQPHIQDKYPSTNKKNGFNIGATQQLSWLLFDKLGLEFSTLTKAGKVVCKELGLKLPYAPAAKRDFIYQCQQQIGTTYLEPGKPKAKKIREPWAYISCGKKTLQKLAPKYKWIEKLLEYQRKTKLLTTYIEGIESRAQYGVIHSSFLQHGTSSGRYSSRNPNWQNLPRDDKRIKECVIARPGKVFVGADYSQLEPRVFAYFSRDERLLAAFKGTDDFYSVIGIEVYGKHDALPQKEGHPDAFGLKYKRLRDLSKVIALASTYGANAFQLAPVTGKSVDETAADIEAYFERFPRVRDMMLESHQIAKKTGQVTNLFGRPRRIPDAKRITRLYGDRPHAELPYEARKLLNLSVNHRIQSTGASIVNRAAIAFKAQCEQVGIQCKIVVQVHDSLVVECAEADAENVSILLQNAMENTTQLEGIDLEAVPKIGKNLAKV